MKSMRTDLPFKLGNQRIIVVKGIPVEQCTSCGEYVIHDPVMESLDHLFESMDQRFQLFEFGLAEKSLVFDIDHRQGFRAESFPDMSINLLVCIVVGRHNMGGGFNG